jgi:hypothetical protein
MPSSFVVEDHSCIVTAKWEWTDRQGAERWSTPQQAYKKQRVFMETDASSETKENGHPVVHSKLKIRGKGKALTIRFESEDGKDFLLLGFAIPFTAAGAP